MSGKNAPTSQDPPFRRPDRFTLLRIRYYDFKFRLEDRYEAFMQRMHRSVLGKLMIPGRQTNPEISETNRTEGFMENRSTTHRRNRDRRPGHNKTLWDADDEESELEPGEVRIRTENNRKFNRDYRQDRGGRSSRKRFQFRESPSPPRQNRKRRQRSPHTNTSSSTIAGNRRSSKNSQGSGDIDTFGKNEEGDLLDSGKPVTLPSRKDKRRMKKEQKKLKTILKKTESEVLKTIKEKEKELKAIKESELEELKAITEKELKELRSIKEKESKELKAIKEKELKELKAIKEKELKELKAIKEKELKDLKSIKEKESKELISMKENESKKLKAIKEMEAKENTLKKKESKELKTVKKNLEKELKTIKKKVASELNTVKKKESKELKTVKKSETKKLKTILRKKKNPSDSKSSISVVPSEDPESSTNEAKTATEDVSDDGKSAPSSTTTIFNEPPSFIPQPRKTSEPQKGLWEFLSSLSKRKRRRIPRTPTKPYTPPALNVGFKLITPTDHIRRKGFKSQKDTKAALLDSVGETVNAFGTYVGDISRSIVGDTFNYQPPNNGSTRLQKPNYDPPFRNTNNYPRNDHGTANFINPAGQDISSINIHERLARHYAANPEVLNDVQRSPSGTIKYVPQTQFTSKYSNLLKPQNFQVY